jgi:hypothetical protein
LKPLNLHMTSHEPQEYSVRWLIACLAAILVITFYPFIFGGKTFLPSDMIDTMTAPFNAEYGPQQTENHYIFDAITQTYPYKTQTKIALQHGRLTYWNPHILAGYPQYAETMGNNYDIFNVLLIWFSPLDVIHWETVLELFIAGIGMIFLLRFLKVSPGVNLIFSTAFMLNSLFIGLASNRWIIASFCWIPLIVLMILRYFSTDRKVNLTYASVFLTFAFFGGNFQTSFFSTFVVSIIILFYPSAANQTILKRLIILISVGVIAFALSAIMWFPTLELLYNTVFGGGSLNSPNSYSDYSIVQRLLSVLLLFTFFFPNVAGNADTFNLKKFGAPDIVNFNGAICFLPALFALWGCYFLWKRKDIRPFILLSILAFVIPIATPLFNFIYHRFFIIASFSLCVVGAAAFQSFLENEKALAVFAKFFKWTKVIFLVFVTGLIAGCTYIFINYDFLYAKFSKFVLERIIFSFLGLGNATWIQGRAERTLHYYSFSSVVLWLPIFTAAITILALSYFYKKKLSARNIQVIVFFTTFIELFIFTRSWLPSVDPKQFPIYPPNPVATYLQEHDPGSRYTPWTDAGYIFAENSASIYKINDIHGYESCSNRSLIIFYNRNIKTDTLDLRLLGLADVKYVVTGRHSVLSKNLLPVYTADSITVYQNLLSKERAYFAYKAQVTNDDSTATKEILRSDFDGSTALFTKEDAPHDLHLSEIGNDSIHFDRYENEDVEITARTNTKGVFILTDTYYPGWKCYVNGIEQPIYRVNYCMRGVVLGPGVSHIEFKFEPVIFTIGASISSISSLVLLGSLLFFRINKKKIS